MQFKLLQLFEEGAELIVTNDQRCRRLTEIQVVVLRDFLESQP